MYSVFFNMSKFTMDVILGILERLFLKGGRAPFKEELQLSIKPATGWIPTSVADYKCVEYRGKNISFRPRFAIISDNVLRGLHLMSEPVEHERIYVGWKELASDEFFKDVEIMFGKLKKSKGVGGSTKNEGG